MFCLSFWDAVIRFSKHYDAFVNAVGDKEEAFIKFMTHAIGWGFVVSMIVSIAVVIPISVLTSKR